MGNRAYVIFEDKESKEFSPAVYLHWNGGPESVYAFLDALDRYEVRGSEDMSYQTSRFIQIVGNFMGGTLSLGVHPPPKNKEAIKNFVEDNGVYVVYRGADGRRVRRMDYEGQWLTAAKIKDEELKAYAHEYHKPEKGQTSIVEQIDEKNAKLFAKE